VDFQKFPRPKKSARGAIKEHKNDLTAALDKLQGNLRRCTRAEGKLLIKMFIPLSTFLLAHV
jgi:hypothetical protein